MRIKSYLALLVFACLLGAYTLEQVLAHYFNHVQTLADKHNENRLWAKDLERIEISTSQFLISSDLVVGSGNTYLIFGAKNMGNYLTTELSNLYSQNHFQNLNNKIENAILNINQIKNILNIVGNISPNKLEQSLSRLLTKYDPVSLALSQDIQFLTQKTNSIIEQETRFLEKEKRFMTKVGWIARGSFFLIIVVLWWWANRKICRPLNELICSSRRTLAGDDFKVTCDAPTEIIELSNDFKQLTQSLFHQASHDPLTGLKNRRAFERHLTEVITDKEVHHFLCFIDLDYFKTINDTCGHAVGDEILISVARILKESIRYKDIVARLGGDEFAILIKDCPVGKAIEIANNIKNNIHELSYSWQSETFQLSASIGLAPKVLGSTTTDLLHSADVACSFAKSAGRNTVRLFDISNDDSVEKRQDTLSVHQINNALSNDLFILYKQDIVALQQQSSGKYFEILLRMKNAHGEIVSPASFFPTAERYHLTSKIDCWVINAVYEHFLIHKSQLEDIDGITINLSGHSLSDSKLEKFIIEKLASGQIPPEKLYFEITEAAAITNGDRTRLFMNNIKVLGCKFTLDDFGSAHSSFEDIKGFPVEKIKIDGSFICNMMENPHDYATVKSLCEMAKVANLDVVAKYVGDKKVMHVLTELGVDYGQGYYFSKPEVLI